MQSRSVAKSPASRTRSKAKAVKLPKRSITTTGAKTRQVRPQLTIASRGAFFAAKFPKRQFTQDHEWIDVAGNVATIGITSHAAKQLGEVVWLEMQAVGSDISAGAPIGVVESVKSSSPIYSPIGGKVVTITSKTVDDLNADADAVALSSIEFTGAVPKLLSAVEYDAHVASSV